MALVMTDHEQLTQPAARPQSTVSETEEELLVELAAQSGQGAAGSPQLHSVKEQSNWEWPFDAVGLEAAGSALPCLFSSPTVGQQARALVSWVCAASHSGRHQKKAYDGQMLVPSCSFFDGSKCGWQ